ncbi:unnamed protein product [Calypogeia fissa]
MPDSCIWTSDPKIQSNTTNIEKVIVGLWVVSTVGGWFSFLTLLYIAQRHLPSTANSALYSFLLFIITLSLQQVLKLRKKER